MFSIRDEMIRLILISDETKRKFLFTLSEFRSRKNIVKKTCHRDLLVISVYKPSKIFFVLLPKYAFTKTRFKRMRRYLDKSVRFDAFFLKPRLSSLVQKLSIAAIKSLDCQVGTARGSYPTYWLINAPIASEWQSTWK